MVSKRHSTAFFLEINNDQEFKQLRSRCEELGFKKKFVKQLYTTEARLNQHFRVYADTIKFFKDHSLDAERIKEINNFCIDVEKINETVSGHRCKLITCNSRLVVSRAKRFLNKA